MQTAKSIVNIAGYKFVRLTELTDWQTRLLTLCQSCELLGSILIAAEGINFNLAGTRAQVDAFIAGLPTEFSGIAVKESLSERAPFKRLRIRIKPEIIRMGAPQIQPDQTQAPRLSPQALQAWYAQGKDFVILDTRNQFEYDMGSFQNALSLRLESFSEFPAAARQLPEEFKHKPLVTFCTGGIRCEKAALLMQQYGFNEVYQLDGGILNYFQACGGDFWEGECFVFDERISLDPHLHVKG